MMEWVHVVRFTLAVYNLEVAEGRVYIEPQHKKSNN